MSKRHRRQRQDAHHRPACVDVELPTLVTCEACGWSLIVHDDELEFVDDEMTGHQLWCEGR